MDRTSAPLVSALLKPHTAQDLLAQHGSPLYVYNEAVLRQRCREMRDFLPGPDFSACYSTKANPNPHLLAVIHAEGLMADAMSPGELTLVKRAGFAKESICYVCNNVSAEELALAAESCAQVSVDSLSQLDTFGRAVPGGRVMLRINPGVGAGHHHKVITAGAETKFGINPEELGEAKAILKRHKLTLTGFNQHVGSLFMDPAPYLEAAEKMLETARSFPGLEVVDFGGGFGIPYRKKAGEARLNLELLGRRLAVMTEEWKKATGFSGRFFTEPGRYVAAECGFLLGTVQAVKKNGPVRYAGTDIGFPILARPMLYDAYHEIELVARDASARRVLPQTVTGNICESGDVLAAGRELPELREGDIVAVLDAGAYGMSMSSVYTQRPRPAEVLLTEDGRTRLIRRRENIADLLALFP